MAKRGRQAQSNQLSWDGDQEAGFPGDQKVETGLQSDFLYDVDVKNVKLAAYRLYNSSKQLEKLQSDIVRKQNKLNRDKTYKSKRLEKHQGNYKDELKEAEDRVIEISKLLHRVPKEVKILDRHQSVRLEKRFGRDNEHSTTDRSWEDKGWRQKLQKAKEDSDNNLAKSNSLQDQINGLIRENDELKKDKAKFQKALAEREQQIKDLQSETARLLRNYNQERAEKDDALTRLSAVASSKIRDNNPNIADLSDVNRPTKIAEKMSELYDNEWTDAFDSLEKRHPDDNIVQKLVNILKNINERCRGMAWQDFFQHVQTSIELPVEVLQEFKPSTRPDHEIVLTKEMQQQIKEFRKLRAPTILPIIQKALVSKDVVSDELTAYYNKCVDVCWLAAVQDPPLFMNFIPGEKFDTTLFKDYTTRGPYVEFLVWPALHLHENGPLLSKGVAQGTRDKIQRSVSQKRGSTRQQSEPKDTTHTAL
ncbi:uncharacterized protein LOC127878196 isoform X2 [Dreissena polymorpha]|nr:uncharacterized protein LOC127878196 isoform X2 [Dreissena polymorpha]